MSLEIGRQWNRACEYFLCLSRVVSGRICLAFSFPARIVDIGWRSQRSRLRGPVTVPNPAIWKTSPTVARSAARHSRAPCGRLPKTTRRQHCRLNLVGLAYSTPRNRKPLIEAHHLKRGAAEGSVGVVQRFADLEMVVVVRHDEPDGLPGSLEGGSELPGLALEFRRFQRAIKQRHRAIDTIEMTLRAERVFGGIGELHIIPALRQSCRLEVVHAGAQRRALHGVARQPEILLPIGDQYAAAQMRSGGVADNVDAVGVAAEACGVAGRPGDGAAYLFDHRHQVATTLDHVDEIEHQEVRPAADEGLRSIS